MGLAVRQITYLDQLFLLDFTTKIEFQNKL